MILLPMLMLAGCLKQRFIPDPFNQALSMLTTSQTNTGTCLINDVPFINYWPESGAGGFGRIPYPRITGYVIPNQPDSIDFSWQIGQRKNGKFVNGAYDNISIRIPAPLGASFKTLMSWRGKRFASNECKVYLNYSLQGSANIYFVAIDQKSQASDHIYISGLFDGNIGDSIHITKGRFDYIAEINF